MINWIMRCVGELIGVMLLVIIANGAAFSVSHKKMFANDSSNKWIIIVFGCATAVLIGGLVSTTLGIKPGHINPAVTIMDSFKNPAVLIFIPFQILGAIIGQIILNFINWKFIIETSKEDKFATRNAHCSNPSIQDKNYIRNFSYELVGTSIFLAIIFITSNFEKTIGLTTNFGQLFLISLTFIGIGTGLGSATGYSLNPAKDLGSRIVYQILKNKMGENMVNANWQYSWIPMVSPLIAGIIFGLSSLAI